MINTLRLSKKLREGGMAQAQAEALADTLNEELKESAITKADLAQAVTDMKHYVLTTVVGVGLLQFGLITGLLLKMAH